MPLAKRLSRIKYWASRPLPPKAYWYVMGKLKPVQAVTSGERDVAGCLASGEDVVRLLDALGVVHPEAVTLHIGSGLGRVEYNLRHHVRKCYGVDISPSMVKRARALVPFDDVEFVCTDGTGLSHWPDRFFDLVYSFLVFQHLPRSQFDRYVAEAFAKLADGGHLVFQLPVDEGGYQPEPPASHPYGIRHFRRAAVEERLRTAGFGEIRRVGLDGKPDEGSMVLGDVVFAARKP